jgi:hypothetical protein
MLAHGVVSDIKAPATPDQSWPGLHFLIGFVSVGSLHCIACIPKAAASTMHALPSPLALRYGIGRRRTCSQDRIDGFEVSMQQQALDGQPAVALHRELQKVG